jgi:hypothetical protein
MGYFHGDVMSGEFDNDRNEVEEGGYLPAEFAIPYKCTINKNYMRFVGQVASGRHNTKKRIRKNIKKKTKNSTMRRVKTKRIIAKRYK